MCMYYVHTILAGSRCRSPVHPLGRSRLPLVPSEHCDQARAEVALSRHRAIPAPANGLVRSITIRGSLQATPKSPMARREISALPLGTPIDQRACHSPLEPSTNRAPIGCRERFVAQPRPLFRQRIMNEEASLEVMIC